MVSQMDVVNFLYKHKGWYTNEKMRKKMRTESKTSSTSLKILRRKELINYRITGTMGIDKRQRPTYEYSYKDIMED